MNELDKAMAMRGVAQDLYKNSAALKKLAWDEDDIEMLEHMADELDIEANEIVEVIRNE